jgi:hypothetical protein
VRHMHTRILGVAAAAAAVTLALTGCGGSHGGRKPAGHHAESAKCRSAGAAGIKALAAVVASDTGGDGDVTMETVDDAISKARTNTSKVVMYCSKAVWEPYDEAIRRFDSADNIDGNACFENSMPRYCNRTRQAHQMASGIKSARKSQRAFDRRTSDASVPGPDDHTIAVRGELRLYDGIEVERNGELGDYFCLGRSGYDDLYYQIEVTVTNAAGRKVALGELDQGQPQSDLWLTGKARKNGKGLCVFPFTVEGLPDTATVYHLEVSRRGGTDFTLRQYRDDPSRLWLTLGF